MPIMMFYDIIWKDSNCEGYGIVTKDINYIIGGRYTMAENKRFKKVYSQGTMNVTEIWVDKETGVNYIFHASGYAGGMTPLLDRDGKPVVSPKVND